jgi:hypothetical protein
LTSQDSAVKIDTIPVCSLGSGSSEAGEKGWTVLPRIQHRNIIRTGGLIMKHILAVSLAFVVVLCATGAFAGGQPLGGVATAEPGHFEVGAGYFYSQDKWDSNTINGEVKLKTNQYYGQFGYGIAPGWDVYVRAGVIDVKGQGDLNASDTGNFFGGIGVHGRLFEKKEWNLSLGPVANFTYYSDWDQDFDATDVIGGVVTPRSGSFKMKNHYSADIGFGFQYKPVPAVTFFGGPFYHYETAKLEVESFFNGIPISVSNNIEPKKSFGPRFGVHAKLTENIGLQLEMQYREYVSAGGRISYSF